MKHAMQRLSVLVAALLAAQLWADDTYDLVIAGGTLDGVRLAVREAAAGRKVYLVAPRPYLGEDRAATLILDRQPSDDVDDPLVREIFNPAYRAAGAYNNLKSKGWRAFEKFAPYESVETAPVPAGELDTVTTPLLVKRACDRALIAAGVKYLTGAQVIGVEPMADGTRKILVAMRDKDETVTARAFADCRMPASVAKGKGRFSFRYVVGPKVHVEKIDFEYDVPCSGVLGWMAVQNHARTLVPISRDLLDVAEMATVESVKCDVGEADMSNLNYDVVVAGGGTGGGPAAMSAARSGAKTLVVEFQHVLGGVATEGRIGGYGGYYDGNVTGFTTELDRGAKAIGRGGAYFFAESEFLRRGIVEAGGEVWLGAMVSGAEVKDGRLTAVKVTMPDGSRVSVQCKAAVDATGNCDLAAAAGCATEYIDPQELSLQGVGMAGQPLGVNCCNSDVGFVDETDAEDLCAFALRSRLSLPDRVWNQSSLVDSRERRRICGRFRITPIDLLLNRTYPDTVCIAESAFDTHGQTVHPIFLLRGTGTRGQKIRGNVPFRALLPRDVEGILVTGLGVSAHRDSMPVLRMKADIRNMGYAAGLAAAMAAKAGVPPSAVDLRQLQRKLIEIGNLPPAVLEAKDSFPLSDEVVSAAVKRLANGYDGLAEIFSDPARALPALRRETSFEAMHVRALLGDSDAAPALVERLDGATWDEGWNFKGMSQYDRCVSKLDAVVLALGPARNPCALPALDALARQLTGKSEYSHFRALARAYGAIGGKDAAASLAMLLKIPGVSGHAIKDAVPPPIPGYSDLAMNAERSDVLRELCVAAALYRIGDPDGSAKRSLTSYLDDPRRVYANFVRKVLFAASPLCAEPTVTRVFRPVRDMRGDENVRRVQDIDDAAWVWAPGHEVWGVSFDSNAWNVQLGAKQSPGAFFRLRNRFTSDGAPVEFDVSADERFTLYLDGRRIAEGPHRGLVEHWYYQSYRIDGLAPGEHLLEAVVWQLGLHAPLAQLSYRGGFILKAAGAYDASLTTGKGSWEIAPLVNTKMTDRGTSRTFGAGSQCQVSGTSFPNEQPPADAWRKAVVVRGPINQNPYGGRTKGWMLFPSDRPDQTYDLKTPGRVVNTACDLAHPFAVPANAERDLWWDLDDYYCAYPVLETSGGAGAEVTWGWTESLRGKDGKKGSRDAWEGKSFSQTFTDTFLPDGRTDAVFTAPWWRCGRWCRLHVKTAGEPLTVRRVAIAESRYPLAVDGAFACDDTSFAPIAKISRRAMEMCMHEMLFDCPYYEQQMYPGDTRIQLNVLSVLTRDPRMTRFAISVYDFDRRDNGMVAMNFPTRGTQESATYSMCWAMMFRDFLMWHDDAQFLRVRMPGMRNTLMGLSLYENADGLLENLPGWSFMDWVRGSQPFADGVSPGGGPGQGVSALNNLQYLHALKSAAAVDEALGEKHFAAHWREKADRLGKAIVAACWDEARGVLADTPKKDRFSEHAQCLAILGGILAPPQRESSFAALAKGEGLAPASSYFAHYLFETYAACGRADLIRDRFAYWRNYIEWGARTAFETQHIDARSDCHAWSACPLYFMQTVFAGVTPSSPFFRTVRVAPQPAGLKKIRAKTPCPQGFIETDFQFDDEKATGTVVLPKGLTGEFVWREASVPLVPGVNKVSVP